MAEIIRIDPRFPEEALLADAASRLRAGQVLGLPTETVYGLAALERPESLARLIAVKGRDPAKPFQVLAPSLEAVEARARIPQRARKLAEQYWPGPLTLVLPDSGAKWLGFRVPALVVTREILRRTGRPVVATSANRSGEPDSLDAGAVDAAVGADVDLILDAGPVQIASPSTVVKVWPDGRHEILREGPLSAGLVRQALSLVVVFVCTGNTCRSPMAEALFRAALSRRLGVASEALDGLGYHVLSAGTAAFGGGPPAANAVVALEEWGLDIRGHCSRGVTPELLDRASFVFALSPTHAHTMLRWLPEHEAKVHILDPQGIPDPIGGSVATYRRCAKRIQECLPEALDRVLGTPEA